MNQIAGYVYQEKILKSLKDLRTPLWLSSHLTEVFIATPEAKYWTGTGGDAIYGSRDGDVFVSMAVEKVVPTDIEKNGYNFQRGLEAWKRDGERIWYLPEYNSNSLCYSPLKETILTFETKPARIEELDAKTGKSLRKLDKTEAGIIGGGVNSNYGGSRICYDAMDHEKFWYADPEHHIVAQTDFSGKIYIQFGEYDVPGNDDVHFKNPKTVSNTNTWGRVLIGDTGNHRVVEYSPNLKSRKVMPFPEPYANYTVANQVAVYTGGNPYSYYGIFILSDHLTCRPVNYLPFNTDSFVVNPQDPTRALIRWDDGLSREIDISGMNCLAPPTTAKLFADNKVQKNTVISSPPIVDYYRPNKSIMLKSTKPGTVLYETAEFTAWDAKWNGSWSVIETYPIKEGKLLRIKDNSPAGITRISIIFEEDGVIDGWVNLNM